MKRYDIDIEDGNYMRSATMDISEQADGKWVKFEEAKQVIDSQQAKIDALMLEFCPDEMTPEQLENWEKHQRLSDMTEDNSNG